jgi:hypothetical protein
MSRRLVLPYAAVVATFIAVAVWTLSGLAGHAGEAIPGTHLADNAAALWNVWWFAYAIEHGAAIYRTPMLLAPYGTQLSLHTHATTHSLLAWPWLGALGIVAAHNVAIACGLALNGVVTAILARTVLSSGGKAGPALPSIVAGLLFALSAFVQARVLGHINLLHAWVLPLFALALIRLQRNGSWTNAIIFGASAALVAYTDYYYTVYAGILALIWIADRTLTIGIVAKPGKFPAFRRVVLALIFIDVVAIVAIALTGGFALDLGPLRASMRGVRNPLTMFWLLLAVWLVCRFPFRVSIRALTRPTSRSLSLGLMAFAVSLLLSAPLWIALARVVADGDYATPRVLWRSSPAGADALTLILGHPDHLISGSWTTAAYRTLGIDAMEEGLWLGIVPLIVLTVARRSWTRSLEARFWAIAGVVFLLLALGPFLRVAGLDTALPLPQSVLRYVPGFSNARMPGRAVVMVTLSVAMLTAFALERFGKSTQWLIAAVLLLETLPAPAAVVAVPTVDAIDRALRESPRSGAVAELPLGMRDGLGESGQLDHRALVHQLWHERPLVGGFVARLPSSVRERYAVEPLLAQLVDLSTPAKSAPHLDENAARAAADLGVDFLIVNRDTFVSERLPQKALENAGFVLVLEDGARELYASSPTAARRPR